MFAPRVQYMYTTSPSADLSSSFCCLGVLLLVFSLDLILEGTLRFLLGVKDTLSFFVHLVQAVVYEWLQQLITILILLRVAINFLFSLILLFSVSHFLTRPSLSSSYGPILLNWYKIYYKRYIWIMLNIFSSDYQSALWMFWFIPLTLDPIIWRKPDTPQS